MCPDYLFFVDEVGCNTSPEQREKIVGKGTVATESATTNRYHFAILGFTH
jgi:hypothetical protein